MELCFNFLWLLIALASFAQWRRVLGVRQGGRRRAKTALPVVALVCALAVLFPSISVTDNLHPGLFMTEDGSRSRRATAALTAAAQGALGHPNHASPPALIANPVLPLRHESIAAGVSPTNFFAHSTTPARISPSRAPPSL